MTEQCNTAQPSGHITTVNTGSRFSGVLLLGPTGSGKTPLGNLLEQTGWWGRRCVHFDFGDSLRSIATRAWRPGRLSADTISEVKDVLARGELLDDTQFGIAAGILTSFAAERNLRPHDLLILNGLPRHVGQARGLEGMVDMKLIVQLVCSAHTVLLRVESNAGGDRRGRIDDTREQVKRRLEIFRERTAPLIGYYRAGKIAVAELEVGDTTGPRELMAMLDAAVPSVP